jgi:protein TonB
MKSFRALSASIAVHSSITGACILIGLVDYLVRATGDESDPEPLVVIETQLREAPPSPPERVPRPKDLPIRLPDQPMEVPPPPEERMPEEPIKPREERPEALPEPPLKPTVKVIPKESPPSAVKENEKSPLRILDAPRPDYPLLARRRGWTGQVEVSFRVAPSGAVEEVKVTASSGYWVLDEACLDAIRRWRYAPTDRSEPIPMSQLFEFRLQ